MFTLHNFTESKKEGRNLLSLFAPKEKHLRQGASINLSPSLGRDHLIGETAFVSNGIGLMKMDNGDKRDMEQAVQAHKNSSKTTSTDAENVDPLTTNISSEKGFLHSLWSRMKGMDPNLRGALLFGAVLIQVLHLGHIKSTATLDFQAGNFSDTDQNFGEAFFTLLPEMVDIATFIGCIFLEVILLWRVHPAAQCVLMPFMMYPPLYYFAELARKASGIGINCKTFKMPAIWFAAVGGVGISFVNGLMILVVAYGAWLYNNKRGLTVREE